MSVLTVSPAPTLAEAAASVAAPLVTPEAPVTPAPEKQPDEPMSSRFAALARKQKQIEADKARLKAERADLEQAKAAPVDPEYAKWKEEQAAAKAKKRTPLEALQEAGYSWDEAANFVINDGVETADTKIKKVETQVEQFIREQKEAKEAAEKESVAKAKEQEEQTIAKYKEDIRSFIDQNAEKYEYIKHFESQDMIFDTINAHYEVTKEEGNPRILSMDEASDLVEAHLEAEAERALANVTKLKAKLKPVEEPKAPLTLAAAFSAKTLNNSVPNVSNSTLPPAKNEEERMQRAIAILKR